MAINKKLIHFKNKLKFNEELANGNILETSIVFILETTEIYTHGLFYDGSTFDPSNIEKSIENIINNKADKTELPTKTSDLTNDSGFITINEIPEVTVPTKVSDLTNDANYITQTTVDDAIDDLASVAISGSYNDLIDKPTIDANIQAVDTEDVVDDVNIEYTTKAYVDGLVEDINSTIGDINSVLESIING